MPTPHRLFFAATLLVATGSVVPTAAAQSPNPCAGFAACSEVGTFVATVTDFRTSKVSYYTIVSATVRFKNKTNRPLILGYVGGSGISTDDQGHRYEVSSAAGVRGIGWITGNTFDSKFTLQPGEFADARIEMSWRPASRADIFGTRWVMELAVREIDQVAATQFRLGREHALQFRGFREGWAPTTTTVAAVPAPPPADAPAAPVEAPAAPPADLPDPCGVNPRCYNSGPFLVEVRSLTPGAGGGRHHGVDVVLRISNITPEPIILGYKSGSSTATDDLGNRYVYGRPSTHDVSFKGIGLIISGRTADPQFVLRPGQSRDASFSVTRFNSLGKQLGTAWSYEVMLTQLEILPSRQIREVRDYSVTFRDLTSKPSAAATLKSAKDLMDAVTKRLKKPN